MDCAEAKLQIEGYVAGEIAADRKGALEEHLAACAECRLDSELTRASRSTPVGPDPNAAPAPFVESIHPDAAPAESPDAAADPAASPPNGATRAPDGSWTLESIFGAAGESPSPGGVGERPSPGVVNPADASQTPASSRDALAERAAAAAEPLPEAELPSILSGSTSRSLADQPPDSDAPTWDFEPADAKGGKPPEGSLFFAEEALSRGTGPKKKRGVPRILVWGAGGLLGIGLLALSIWIAMTVRQPLPPAGVAEHRPIRAGTGPEAPSAVDPAPGAGAPEAPAGAAPGSSAEMPAPGVAASAPAPVVETPAGTGATRPADTAPAGSAPPSTARASTPIPPPQPPSTTARTTTPAKPPATTARTTTARTTTVAKTPATSKPAASKPAAIKPLPAGEDDDLWSDDDIAALRPPSTPKTPRTGTTSSGAAAKSPERATTSGAANTTSGAATTTSGTATPAPSTGSTATTGGSATGAAADPSAAAPPAPGDTVERPIDRLHLATLNAEQNADLVALRKLRDAWRGFVKSSIGPDRARAKRELADCLWAVQTLTSRRSDQKEALAAYRDYVLNAPAGGADARTVARMRQLEDAVAESR